MKYTQRKETFNKEINKRQLKYQVEPCTIKVEEPLAWKYLCNYVKDVQSSKNNINKPNWL